MIRSFVTSAPTSSRQTRPRPKTITRSQSERELLVVGARAEDVHAALLAPRSRISSKICCRAPTSTPCVGSSSSRSRGSVWNHFASSAFCWLPPRERAVRQRRVVRPHVELAHQRARSRGACAARSSAIAVEVAVEHRRARGSPTTGSEPTLPSVCRSAGISASPAAIAAGGRQLRAGRASRRRATSRPARAGRAP